MKILIEHGADVNLKQFNQETALHEAAAKGNSQIIA